MRAIVFNSEARQDFSDIWEFIVRDSVDAADRVRLKMQAAIERLAEMPGWVTCDRMSNNPAIAFGEFTRTSLCTAMTIRR